jgi:hypothetical protein
METKVAQSGLTASNRKRSQGSSWTVAPAKAEGEEEEATIIKHAPFSEA